MFYSAQLELGVYQEKTSGKLASTKAGFCQESGIKRRVKEFVLQGVKARG